MRKASASITAQNTFTSAVEAISDSSDIGASISGTFTATITIQRSLDGGATWNDLPTTYTGPAEINIIPVRSAQYRVGVKTGDFGSGTAVVAILS